MNTMGSIKLFLYYITHDCNRKMCPKRQVSSGSTCCAAQVHSTSIQHPYGNRIVEGTSTGIRQWNLVKCYKSLRLIKCFYILPCHVKPLCTFCGQIPEPNNGEGKGLMGSTHNYRYTKWKLWLSNCTLLHQWHNSTSAECSSTVVIASWAAPLTWHDQKLQTTHV